ncbi:MAG: hypothetical protein V3R72_09675 [Gammaproteobacteria bacterium]
MRHLTSAFVAFVLILPLTGTASAHGVVNSIVNAPLAAAGTVRDGRVGINVYLQSASAPGPAFMDPKVPGYGIPAGGYLEIEMGDGFERDWEVALSQAAIMLVTGTPQQGLPGKKVGYSVAAGDNDNTFRFTPTTDSGLSADRLMSPAPGAKLDPIPQRGIKVVHIGFQQSAFFNRGSRGEVHVRFVDGSGKAVHQGTGTIAFLGAPVAQVLPTNFTDKRRNHNWQRVQPGQILGVSAGTVPITLMMYARAKDVAPEALVKFRDGIVGAGILSTQQINAMGYEKPAALARYNGGLILRDRNGDGVLTPGSDEIIGGVIAKAPAGAEGQELRSLERDGKPLLSEPTQVVAPKPGKRWGGAIMKLAFTAGNKPGLYRPTLALLKDPRNPAGGDGSKYTYTIVVE